MWGLPQQKNIEPNGLIAQYNESERRHWSFFRQRALSRHLEWVKGYWVELRRVGDRWEAIRWE